MTTLREFAPFIGIALFVIAMGAVFVRFKFADSVPHRVPVAVFAVVSLAFLLTGAGLRLHEQQVLNRPLTVGDIVRPDLEGELPTDVTVESWQAALEPLGLEWTSRDELLVDRPQDLLSFDGEYTGYMEGHTDDGSLRLTAVIGFEGTEISWFACHAAGLDELDISSRFFSTCITSAEIAEIDPDAVAEWVGDTLSSPSTEVGGIAVTIARECPVRLMAASIVGTEPRVNAQLTVSRGELC
ncbi:hypothetical protein GCM10009830_40560 [Glycomyces endophyticus]|uniref:Uncharacterized protein n=1 Tax=Glycomyces endophyticus TaxID=480996 RepID=A0ABP4TIS7_9ACTN